MEVGDQGVEPVEDVAGADVEVGLPRKGLESASGCGRFEGACGGGADGDDPSATLALGVQGLSGFWA